MHTNISSPTPGKPEGNALDWLRGTFAYLSKYRKAWFTCGALFFTYEMVALCLLPSTPLVQLTVDFIRYLILAGLLCGCLAQDQDKPFTSGYLFIGFSNRTLSSIGATAFIWAMISWATGLLYKISSLMLLFESDGLVTFLLALVLILVGKMLAAWVLVVSLFSMMLVSMYNASLYDSIRCAVKAGLNNVSALLLYIIGITVLLSFLSSYISLDFVMAVFPFMAFKGDLTAFVIISITNVLLIFFIPMMIVSVYLAFKDIFSTENKIEV